MKKLLFATALTVVSMSTTAFAAEELNINYSNNCGIITVQGSYNNSCNNLKPEEATTKFCKPTETTTKCDWKPTFTTTEATTEVTTQATVKPTYTTTEATTETTTQAAVKPTYTTTEATTETTTQAVVKPTYTTTEATTETTTQAAVKPTYTTTEATTETTTQAAVKPTYTTTEATTETTTQAAVKPTYTTTEATTEITTSATDSSIANQLLKLVNNARAENGLSPLTLNSDLSAVAQKKADDMKNNNYFSHTSPTYGSPFDMIKNAGISYKTAGENIAKGQSTAEAVFNAWMNSSGHRANILNKNFTQMGIGVTNGTRYWSQMFIG